MYFRTNLLVFFVYGLTLCECFDNEWNNYEKKFRNANREEIFIANATANTNFKLNVTVEKWKTLTVGGTCYTGGISNDSMLVVLFSTVLENRSRFVTSHKIFDLNITTREFEFFHKRKNGKDTIFVIMYDSEAKNILWYSLRHYYLNKISTWKLEKDISHFSTFKMESKDMFMAITTNNLGIHSADIYEFDSETLTRWFYQTILLQHAASSSCVSSTDTAVYLSIPQTSLNHLQIYQHISNRFIPYQNISAPKINQVLCFENGFKSFMAINGLTAGIYEFTEDGLVRETIANSNLEGILFWLAIPVNTYRDETILLCQRQLDHSSHFSFDVDVIIYNGNRFEEHEDIPCQLFGEQQSGLKCLTEYDPQTGIEGSSYIAVSDLLSLIVPVLNGTSILFDLNVGIRNMEHPAKKEFETMLELKNRLQAMIDDQRKEHVALTDHRKKLSQKATISKESTPLDPPNSLLGARSSDGRIYQLRDQIEQFVRDLDDLNERVRNRSDSAQTGRELKTIIFNGPVEIQGDLQSERISTKLIDGQQADSLLNDIVRKDEVRPIEGPKHFEDLTVENIHFDDVNGFPSENFVTKHGKILLDGSLTFEHLINIESIETTLVDGVDTSKEWIKIDQILEGPYTFDQLRARNAFNTPLVNGQEIGEKLLNKASTISNQEEKTSMFIPGNVTINKVNGEHFESFLKKLCIKNITCHIPNLTVNGKVNVKGNAQTNYLNDLRFPEDYVSLEPLEKVVITGSKDFKNITRGYKVVTNSTLNNINVEDIIKRCDEEHILGNITFDDLEVASILKVDGKVKGEGIDEFAPNLGLKDTNILKSNAYFTNLEVKGNIIVENNFNDTDFNIFLQDFIFENEENVTINAKKIFSEGLTVRQNLHIDSNKINNISLDSIITKDTPQQLELSSLYGSVDFENFYVEGEFDGERINELNDTLVKIPENETVTSKLVFLEPVIIEQLSFDELNDLNRHDQDFHDHINSTVENILDVLDVEELIVEGDIIGTVSGFDLGQFRENYLSYTKDQIISEPYFIDKLDVNFIKAIKINDIDVETTFSYGKYKDNVTDFLVYRTPYIENLNVDGSVTVETINERNLSNLIENNAWVKIFQNGYSRSLSIDGDVYFKTLQIKNLASADFEEYISNLIFKNESDVKIGNSINFVNGIIIEKLLETKTLNDVALENILRKDGEQILSGPIDIMGNVTVKDDITVAEMVNNVDVRFITENLEVKENSATIRGEVIFHRLAYIRDLLINGSINGTDIKDILSKLVFTDEDITLENNTIFNDTVHINMNLGISKDINGVLLSDFVSQVLWITQDADIHGSIKFSQPVECYKSISVEDELITNHLFGQKLEDIVSKGVFIDKGLLRGSYTFEELTINDYLKTQFINNLNMSNIIPLKTDQVLENLEIAELETVHDIPVGNRVNGIVMKEELNKTLLKNAQQEMVSEIVFLNNVMVDDKLTAPMINNKPSSKIVTINTDQNLTAVYNFNTKCWADKDVEVHGLIDGINLTFWKHNSVVKNLDNSQKIEGEWTVAHDLNMVGPLIGDGVMNGINITKLINDVKERGRYKYDIEKGIVDDYNNLCTDVSYIYQNAKNQIYKFEYFEELQKINTSDRIHYVKYFEHQEKHYLLINEHNSCNSRLMEFRENGFYQIKDIHTGIISQAIVARENDETFFVTRGEDSEYREDLICRIRFSTVVWKFESQTLELLAHFENQELLQESKVPLSFYGLKHGVVTEFQMDDPANLVIRKYRSWNISEENAAFLPRGLKTGLALRTGKDIIYLNRNEPVIDDDFGTDTEAIIKGTSKKAWNIYIPGRIGGDITVTNVGIKKARKSLLAVSSHKKSRVEHRLDIVEIYLNPFTGELFDKIPTYRPSSLTSIELENGETLLAFMEEKKVLQIFEYKGIEGFKHRSSIKIPAHQLILMDLPKEGKSNPRKVLGLIHKNVITLLEAVMVGNKIEDGLTCTCTP